MKVLLIGANGFLGPHVVRELASHHQLRITDIKPPADEFRVLYSDHEFMDLDITDARQVQRGVEGMDAIVNLSVVRQHPELAFRVNMLGCYHVMRAAVQQGIRRVINTGPHFTIAGPSYEGLDFSLTPDMPPHPGTGLYPLTKSLGQEICKTFTAQYDVFVQEYLFYSLREPDELRTGRGGVPFVVAWEDAAQSFRLGLDIELTRLPSRCEVFFILGDCPQHQFLNEKAKRVLGYRPRVDVSRLWRRPPK